ncbi:MAG: gamma-glutamyl kinase [Alphaproteobacteria bacterium]|nr:MAG: gamma-glutamyl kinase [Alphaproteobacteria bacterium]
MILTRHRLAYLAVPKTATHAVEAALAADADVIVRHPPPARHMNLATFERVFRPWMARAGVKELETVAVMREPIDWLYSWFRYRARPQIRGTPQSTEGLDFERFVRGYLSRPRPPFAQVGQQSRFVSGGADRPRVDHLFAYERLEQLAAFLSDRLGREIRFERVNASPPRAALRPETLLEPLTLSRLRSELADDIAWHAELLARG